MASRRPSRRRAEGALCPNTKNLHIPSNTPTSRLSATPACADANVIRCIVANILASNVTRSCLQIENLRIQQRLQTLSVRVFKDFKARQTGRLPNLVLITTDIARRMQGIRICPLHFDVQLRRSVTDRCTAFLTRMINSLFLVCPTLLQATRFEYLVIGLLYLMRVGLSMNGVCLLPTVPELTLLLPLESMLFSCFNIRAKCVTDIENMIKLQLRGLSKQLACMVCESNNGDVL